MTHTAAQFWFHTFNGLRHLGWDTGFSAFLRLLWPLRAYTLVDLDLKKSYVAGYIVLGSTAVATCVDLARPSCSSLTRSQRRHRLHALRRHPFVLARLL